MYQILTYLTFWYMSKIYPQSENSNNYKKNTLRPAKAQVSFLEAQHDWSLRLTINKPIRIWTHTNDPIGD